MTNEIDLSIKDGTTTLTFSLPQTMDINTAKGVVQQLSQFIKILDKQSPMSDFGLVQNKTRMHLSPEEQQEFLTYYKSNGRKATMDKYGLTSEQVYSRAYNYESKTLTKNVSNKKQNLSQRLNKQERMQFLNYYDKNGMQKTKEKFNMEERLIRKRVYKYRHEKTHKGAKK